MPVSAGSGPCPRVRGCRAEVEAAGRSDIDSAHAPRQTCGCEGIVECVPEVAVVCGADGCGKFASCLASSRAGGKRRQVDHDDEFVAVRADPGFASDQAGRGGIAHGAEADGLVGQDPPCFAEREGMRSRRQLVQPTYVLGDRSAAPRQRFGGGGPARTRLGRSGSGSAPTCSSTYAGASAIHSPTASSEVAPASTAHAVSASTTARRWHTPRGSRGSGTSANRSSRPGTSSGPACGFARSWSRAGGIRDDASAGTVFHLDHGA